MLNYELRLNYSPAMQQQSPVTLAPFTMAGMVLCPSGAGIRVYQVPDKCRGVLEAWTAMLCLVLLISRVLSLLRNEKL